MTEETRLPVLIVEDDEPTQQLLRAVLRRSGYESEVTANGAEAIAQLQKNRYAVVVLDMMMPEVSGHDVIAFLADSGNPTPVVICSAAGRSALSGLDPNVVKAIVRKPFDIDEFVSTVIGTAAGKRSSPP